MPQLILTILLIALGWFLLIRPQQARVRAQRAMVETLEVGDQVITAGGIHGRITALSSETVQLLVAPGTELKVARAAIMRRLEIEDTDGVADGTEDDVRSENDDVAPGDAGGEA
ncbi:MAG: preprotein translocase subunit YajC [Acidimicrobiales bacterium]|nr:preprotein translocase subunit YajC [Acidimicrobiales bacterium]